MVVSLDKMSYQSRLAVSLVTEMFGPLAGAIVADIANFKVKTIGQIVNTSGLSLKETKAGLAVLVTHGFVSISDERKPGTKDYALEMERILFMMRLPKYLQVIKDEFGEWEELIMDYFFRKGVLSASSILLSLGKKIKTMEFETDKEKPDVFQLLPKLRKLIQHNVLGYHSPEERNRSEDKKVEGYHDMWGKDHDLEFPDPIVNLKEINDAVINDSNLDNTNDKNILFRPNFGKLNQKLRDKVIVDASVRRVDESAGKVLAVVLDLVDLGCNTNTSSTPAVSTEVSQYQISDKISKQYGQESHEFKFLDQYLRILVEDKARFLDKIGDRGGGTYGINFKLISQNLADASLNGIILEKFGSKALRIFKFIREKKFVEEHTLQKCVMIPSKEAKMLTYNLMENHFIHLQELRKTISANAPTKAFYLYYVHLNQAFRTVVSLCHKALYNLMVRGDAEKEENLRLLEKHARIETLAEELLNNGGTQEQLEEVEEMMSPPEREAVSKVHQQLQKLANARIQVEETLFIIETYVKITETS